MDRAVRAGHPERSIARPGDAVAFGCRGGGDAHAFEPDLAEALQLRDVLLLGRDALVAVVAVRVVGEGLLEEANLALKQRFAVRATYAGQGDPVIDVSVVAAESVDGSHRGHEPCKVARNARLEMDSRPGWPGYSPRLLAPTRPPNKCARPSTLMRTLTVYCACRGPFSPCRVTTTAAIHPPLARPVRGGSKVGRVPLARPNRCDGLLDRLLKLAAPACRVDGAVPDLAVRGDRSHEPVHARTPSCS